MRTRAGSGTAYFFGDSSATLGDYAWYGSEAGGMPHPVGMKSANPWGLYDILGNVGEWTLDIWAWGDNYKETFGAEWQADNTVTVVDPVVLTDQCLGQGPLWCRSRRRLWGCKRDEFTVRSPLVLQLGYCQQQRWTSRLSLCVSGCF